MGMAVHRPCKTDSGFCVAMGHSCRHFCWVFNICHPVFEKQTELCLPLTLDGKFLRKRDSALLTFGPWAPGIVSGMWQVLGTCLLTWDGSYVILCDMSAFFQDFLELIVLKAAHSLNCMFKPSEQIRLAAIPVLFSCLYEPRCHMRDQELKRPCSDQPHATLRMVLPGGPASVGSCWASCFAEPGLGLHRGIC